MAAHKKVAAPTTGPKRAKVVPRKIMPARKDFGAPTDAYFAQQPPEKRVLLEKLRALVLKVVPDADASIKWGVPFYGRQGKSVCSIAAFKEHVGINFFAPPSVLVDPTRSSKAVGRACAC